jgi:hypothetical protein
MKHHRAVVVVVLVALSVSALMLPAQAKKKKKPKPVASVLFMEGISNFGEEDQVANSTYLKLQPEEGSGEKSVGIPNYVGGPNSQCAGNSLVPVFIGSVTGKIVGDMKVTFNAVAPGGQVEVRVWPDVAAQACNEQYPAPAGAVTVDLPSGEGTVEATIEGLNFSATSLMMVQITPVLAPPAYYARAFYGDANSKVEFSCIPAAGAKSCLS